MSNEHRYINTKTGKPVLYLETIRAMCKNRMGWFSHKEWARIEAQIPNMNEEEAKEKVYAIYREEQVRIQEWRRTQ